MISRFLPLENAKRIHLVQHGDFKLMCENVDSWYLAKGGDAWIISQKIGNAVYLHKTSSRDVYRDEIVAVEYSDIQDDTHTKKRVSNGFYVLRTKRKHKINIALICFTINLIVVALSYHLSIFVTAVFAVLAVFAVYTAAYNMVRLYMMDYYEK